MEAGQDKLNQWSVTDFLVRCFLVPDKSVDTLHPRFVALPIPYDQRRNLADWHVAKEVRIINFAKLKSSRIGRFFQEPGYPSLSFSQSKSYTVKWAPKRKTETVPAFGLPSFPVYLGVQPVDPKKAVRAIRKLMSEIPAAYVVTRTNFNDLTRTPGVATKSLVSPSAWPVLVEKESESDDDEGKNLSF